MAATKKPSTGTKKTTATTTRAAPNKAAAKKSAPRKASKRADFGAPIGPWFEQLPPEKRAPLEKLRALVEATVPNAQSGLKWDESEIDAPSVKRWLKAAVAAAK